MTTVPGPLPARVAGGLLAVLLGPVAAVRRGRALHPEGATLRGALRLAEDPLLPGAGYEGPAVVRISRAAGLPPGAPDVHGLAVRWGTDAAPRDLLLASTGTSPVGRFVLTSRRSPWGGAFGSLMPFRGPRGPFLLGATPQQRARGDTRDGDLRVDVELRVATPTGRWRRCGSLVADARTGDDPRFDPVRHAAFPAYGWAAALRLPSYAAARHHGRPVF